MKNGVQESRLVGELFLTKLKISPIFVLYIKKFISSHIRLNFFFVVITLVSTLFLKKELVTVTSYFTNKVTKFQLQIKKCNQLQLLSCIPQKSSSNLLRKPSQVKLFNLPYPKVVRVG